MNFRTVVDVPKPSFAIEPLEQLLFVGSCFADSIGQRFKEEGFPTVINPFGVMYNPVSVLHTIDRCEVKPQVVFLTLGTNHIYRLKATGEVVDNCQKRPQSLFSEETLTIEECTDYLLKAVRILADRQPDVRVVITVSPIRYAKYGYHGSQLSKAVLLLAAERVAQQCAAVSYFPAYEIVLDELRDYRFYQPDMHHPSGQAVDYIWERLVETYFSQRAKQYLEDWRPIKEALGHRPFDAESEAYKQFLVQTKEKEKVLRARYINKV